MKNKSVKKRKKKKKEGSASQPALSQPLERSTVRIMWFNSNLTKSLVSDENNVLGTIGCETFIGNGPRNKYV